MGTLTRTDEDPEVARMLQSIADTRRERDDLRRHNEMLDRELAIAKSTIDRLEHEKDQLQRQRDDAIARSAALQAGYKAVRAAIEANDPDPKWHKPLRQIEAPTKRNGPAPLERMETELAELAQSIKAEPADQAADRDA